VCRHRARRCRVDRGQEQGRTRNAAAVEGRWSDALAAFDAEVEINRLGLHSRAHLVGELSDLLEQHSVTPVDWYGVRLLTDNRPMDAPPPDDEDECFAVELEASRRDPYRQLSRLFHLVGRKAPR
jgi:hypothetical protein